MRTLAILISVSFAAVVLPSVETQIWRHRFIPGLPNLTKSIPGSNCTFSGQQCICLPNVPPTTDPPFDLMELLTRGSDFLKNYTHVDEAILFLGITGSGKTTATQIVAGNLSRLHSVVSYSKSVVIVDEDDRIGLPSTKSKTLFPELVYKDQFDDDPRLPFYDFPGFDDTRGPVEDLAANFFMNEVVKKISKVRMFFLAVDSAFSGDTRDGLANLVSHAVQFVKSIEDFVDSIGIISTKVRGVDDFGNPKSDAEIQESIANALLSYNAQLHQDLDDGSGDENLLRKKITFLEALLEKNSENQYSRIWFVRTPRSCGRLSEQEIFQNIRGNITNLYRNLAYTPVGDVDENFGFTLKDSTIREITNYSRTVNKEVVRATTQVAEEFSQRYFEDISHEAELEDITSRLWEHKQFVDDFITDLYETLVTSPNPDILSSKMQDLFRFIGYPLRTPFHNFMKAQASYLDFFDKAAEETQLRDIDAWLKPLQYFQTKLNKYSEWYQFCYSLQTKLFAHTFHLTKPPLPANPDDTNWLEFVNETIEIVSPGIFEAAAHVRIDDLNVLKHMMLFVLHPNSYYCLNDSDKAVVIHGNFLHQQIFESNISSFVQNCGNAKNVVLLSGHTIYLTKTLKLDGLGLSILSPIIAEGSTSDIEIFLEGKAGTNHSPANATKGSDGTQFSSPTGGNHGCAGKPGSPGGNAFVLVSSVKFSKNVTVNTNGGNGGNGQHGGLGGSGYGPNDAHCIQQGTSACVNKAFTRPDLCQYSSSANTVQCVHYGFSGGNGASGGNGGKPGVAGIGGDCNIIHFQSHLNNTVHIVRTSSNAQAGQPGYKGIGGAGGRAGKGYTNVASEFCAATEASNGRRPGSKGSDGTSGTSSSCLQNPVQPEKVFPYWHSILEYRRIFYAETNSATVSFLRSIDTDNRTLALSSLKDLAEESLMLENMNRTAENNGRLTDMYSSLVSRLQHYYTVQFSDLTEEHQKILSMLLTSSFASLQSLRQLNGLNIVVDVSGYLTTVVRQIRIVSQINDRNALNATIHSEKEKYVGSINDKIQEAIKYSEEISGPAVEAAEEDIRNKLSELGNDLEDLINDANLSLEDAKEKLRKAEKELRRHRFWKIFSAFSGFASLIPGGDIFDGLVKGIADKYANAPEKVAALKELVKELEELNKDLDEKHDEFVEDLVPFVHELLEYFLEASRNITSGNDITLPDLLVRRYEILGKIRECKSSLVEFADESLNHRPITNAIDRLHDSLTLSLDLYEAIDQYQDAKNLAKYIAVMQSAMLGPIEITDPDFVHTLANFDLKVKENILDQQVETALHAFRQWIFPFAKFYLALPKSTSLIPYGVGDAQLLQVEELQYEIDRYKTMIVAGIDGCIFQTSFSSGLITSKPFYTWAYEDYPSKVKALLSGEIVNFYADVALQGHLNRESIKFKLIEINLKLNGALEGYEEEFKNLTDFFAVSLTHSGISHYRFMNEYYVMTGGSQTLMYNFERDENGNRLGTNMVYEKFKNGDYLLSPYTMWSVQLSYAEATRRVLNRGNVSFDDFEKFIPYVDIELVGVGTYVDGKKALENANGDLMLDKYYFKEERLTQF